MQFPTVHSPSHNVSDSNYMYALLCKDIRCKYEHQPKGLL